MPTDPNFRILDLDNPSSGFSYVANVGGSGYWAWENAYSPRVAGDSGGDTMARWLRMSCNGQFFYDGTFHAGVGEFNAMDEGPDSFLSLVGDAADALLAVQPDLDYFTLEPAVELSLHAYQDECPTSFSAFGVPNPPINPAADAPVTAVRKEPFMRSDAQVYLAGSSPSVDDQLDLAISYAGDWYVDDHWGPDMASAPESYPLFGGLGSVSGLDSYILRPTALAWTGQDATNTANRIFWERADIPDAITHSTDWKGGHPTLIAWIAVRGWKLTAVATGPVICFV